MNIDAAFPSKYLKVSDLQGKVIKITIRAVEIETLGKGPTAEKKPILYFEGKTKGLVLNKTNANMIASLYGPDTDAWTGCDIELLSVPTEYQGRATEGLRVRNPRPTPKPVRQPTPEPEPPVQTYHNLRDEIDDEIPF